MGYLLKIHNVGKEPKLMQVIGVDGYKRNARFTYEDDAREAVALIESLRIDTAFQGVELVED